MIPQAKGGFTLIEMLLVVAVITILASIAVFAVRDLQPRIRDRVRWTSLQELVKATEAFYADHGYYPVTCCYEIGCLGTDPTAGPYYSSPNDPYFRGFSICSAAAGTATFANIGEALMPYIGTPLEPKFNLSRIAGGYVYCSADGQSYAWHVLRVAENMYNYDPSTWNTRRCTNIDANGQCTTFFNDVMITHRLPSPFSCN